MSSIDAFADFILNGNPRSFDEVLEALKEVPVELLTQPEMLHRHVLGFVQSRIATLSGRELRIHHWPAGANFAEEPHTHLWDLTSYVLSGTMRSLTYKVEPSEAATDFQLLSVKQLESGTLREPLVSNVAVVKLSENEYRNGSFYTVRQGTFHTSEPSRTSALTLITTTQPSVPRPHVAVARDSAPPRFGVAPMTPPTTDDVTLFRDALRIATS